MVPHWPPGQLKHLTSTASLRLALTGPNTCNSCWRRFMMIGDNALLGLFPNKMLCVGQDMIDTVFFIYFYFFGIVYWLTFLSILFWLAPRCYFKSFNRRTCTKTPFIQEMFQSIRKSDLIFKRTSIPQKHTALQSHSHQQKFRGSFLEGFFQRIVKWRSGLSTV